MMSESRGASSKIVESHTLSMSESRLVKYLSEYNSGWHIGVGVKSTGEPLYPQNFSSLTVSG